MVASKRFHSLLDFSVADETGANVFTLRLLISLYLQSSIILKYSFKAKIFEFNFSIFWS